MGETLAKLLETLVNIPSETGHEAAIADWVEARVKQQMMVGDRTRSGNCVIWRGPRRGRPLMVLAGHLDTVPANGNSTAWLENDRLYGVGSTDMKGGDAVMLSVLEGYNAESARFDLAAVFYDAEEGPQVNNGLRRLFTEQAWLKKAQIAVLLEPTDLKVELGCSGSINAEVRVAGRAAHSARPWTGLNAISRAVGWLGEVTRFPATTINVQGVDYRETLQVTTLHAGRARNVIPDELVANLNYRFPPDRTADQAETKLRGQVPPDFKFDVVDRAEPGRVCADAPEVKEFTQRFGATVAGKQGWTDVSQFTAAGVPAFNFGPGVPELAHQSGEYCPVKNLDVAAKWLGEFIARRA